MLRLASCVVVAVIMAAGACADLSSIPAGTCGNGAVDQGEECDGAAPDGQACGSSADANACHFVCSNAAACPSGFACGLDERCRAPTGTFAPAPGPYSFVANEYRAGDVDGDHYADLIGVEGGRIQVRYGNATGDLSAATEQLVPAAIATPAISDLDGDGRVDVLVPTTTGMVTLLGAAGGFEPHPYSSIALDTTLNGDVRARQVHPFAGLTADLLLIYDELDTTSGDKLHEQLAYAGSKFAACFDGTPVDTSVHLVDDICGATSEGSASIATLLGGDVVVGRTGYAWTCTASPFPGAGSCDSTVAIAADATDEVVVAVEGQAKVALLSASEDVPLGVPDPKTAALAHVQDIAMPPAHDVAANGRAMFADFDGDGCPDLAIPVTNGSNANGTLATATAIAFNTGCTGKLDDAVLVKSLDLGTVSPQVGKGSPRLYADLDGDGRADIVTDTQIYLATCGSACAAHYTGHGAATVPRAWTTAITTDINGDGRADIAGFVTDQADVDVLLNGGDGTFTRFTVLTDLPVLSIATGDFDGDLLQDVAIVTGDASTSEEVDELFVAFGATSGGPEPPIAMGSFGVIRSLATAALETTPNDPEHITDLIVVDDRAAHRNGALLLGSPSRQVIAPFEINEQASLASPIALLIGNFDGSGGNDVAELSLGGDAYVLSGTTGGDVTLGATDALGAAVKLAIQSRVALTFSRGALGSGALDSAVGFVTFNAAQTVPALATCPATEVVVGTPPASSSGAWNVVDTGALGSTMDPSGACLRIHGSNMRDLDGDGAADALAQLCAGASSCDDGETVVAWGASGTVDATGATPIPAPSGLICGRFAPIVVSTTGGPDLAVPCVDVTSAAAVLVRFALDPMTRTWHEVSRFPLVGTDLRVQVGDFNGDRLDDLALTAGTGADAVSYVYVQCAAGDASCAAIPVVTP